MNRFIFLLTCLYCFIANAQTNNHFNEHKSQLNIPLVHSQYNNLEYYLHKEDNTHTTFKPFLFNELEKADLTTKKEKLFKNKSSFFGKKLWNEHFVNISGDDYWFTVDPMFDLQVGKDNSDNKNTYNNTRALRVQGGLGKKLNFSTSFYESQGRFADYIHKEIYRLVPLGAGGTVPGRGKAKPFKEKGADYPVAEAYLSYTPNKMFNFQFGNGKNFIGDGYRSFMLSDVASPYTYLKVSTNFWKVKYTNLWMWADDVRRSVSINDRNLRKYISIHHLSWNVTKKFNLGLFEAVIINNENNRGYDVEFFNPVIFYRAVEFTKGSESGNAIVGLNAKYKLTNNSALYSQFVLDELTVGEFFSGNGYWGNKYAFQLGAKFYNAFKVNNLFLQAEYNMAKPYIFSHFGNSTLNYAHFNQPLGHLWDSNFWETVGVANYQHNRWFANAKITYGKKGFDFDTDNISYGGDIYRSYDERPGQYNVKLLQGNKTSIFIGDLQAGYIVNPSTNLRLFAGYTYRNFNMLQPPTKNASLQNTNWITFGLKTDVFNWYFDF